MNTIIKKELVKNNDYTQTWKYTIYTTQFINEIIKQSDNRLGFLVLVVDNSEKTATITNFFTQLHNQGIGSKLLCQVISDCKEININLIELDDMTDRYRKSNNIYLKFGFKYVDVYGPEMILHLNYNS